ncbi:hypothetical protein TELCIR_05423 [Teladorsagia circumcincta]|uniref:Uncharacterized protein n=1 Tax=Teladorsagia circumcincta TaxID=45464 RepID=A0A2G9UQZ2_TELCI|nr:hypothetical protein TELCIR_05423 [Teladorsagia circumcincta]
MHTSLLRLESTSSLPYRKLLEAETLSVDAEFKYPRVFNAKQTWDFKFRLTKCCCWLVWDHQRFVTDLINEFVGDTAADLVSFIPYTVNIDFDVSDSFEEEWHEIWRTESIICIIDYTYHPTVPRIASDLPLHVLQEFLPKPVEHPKDLPPDKMNVKLEIGGSEVMFTGSLIKCVIELKNNYFGLYDSVVGSQPGRPCESEETLKYRQMRISVDGVQLALTDENNAITLTVDPIRFTLCNAHEKRFTEHICVRIPQVKALQLFHPADSPTWIECARASISGVSLDVEVVTFIKLA